MKQLTSAELAEIKSLLAHVGLRITRSSVAAKSDYLSRVRAWTPMTASGRSCKAQILRLASMPKFTHLQGGDNA